MIPTPPRALATLVEAEPDLVDRIFEYIFSDPALAAALQKSAKADDTTVDKLKSAVRSEFCGEMSYIANKPATERQKNVAKTLSLFNGRNATEVARRLGIGRTTVYRYLKQAGGTKS